MLHWLLVDACVCAIFGLPYLSLNFALKQDSNLHHVGSAHYATNYTIELLFWLATSEWTIREIVCKYGRIRTCTATLVATPLDFNLHWLSTNSNTYLTLWARWDSNPHTFRHWFLRPARLPFRHLPKKQTHQDLHSHLIAKTSEHDNYSAYVGKFIFAGNCLSLFPVNHFTQGFLWKNLLSLFVFNL